MEVPPRGFLKSILICLPNELSPEEQLYTRRNCQEPHTFATCAVVEHATPVRKRASAFSRKRATAKIFRTVLTPRKSKWSAVLRYILLSGNISTTANNNNSNNDNNNWNQSFRRPLVKATVAPEKVVGSLLRRLRFFCTND